MSEHSLRTTTTDVIVPSPDSILTEAQRGILQDYRTLLDESGGDHLDLASGYGLSWYDVLSHGVLILGVAAQYNLEPQPSSWLPPVLAAAWGGNTVHKVFRDRSRVRGIAEKFQVLSDVSNQVFAGETVVIYEQPSTKKSSSNQRAVVWHGPIDEESVASTDYLTHRLTALRQVMTEGRCDKVVLPAKIVQELGGPAPADEETKLTSWLKDIKPKLKFETKKDVEVVVMTPQRLDSLITAAREQHKQAEQGELIGRIMSTLLAYKPNHPLSTWYNTRTVNPKRADKQLMTQLKKRLEIGLTRSVKLGLVGEQPDEPDLAPGETDYPLADIRGHQTGSLHANGRQVIWQTEGHHGVAEASALADEYSLSQDMIEQVLASPARFPRPTVVRACELALWQTLQPKTGADWRPRQRTSSLAMAGEVHYTATASRVQHRTDGETTYQIEAKKSVLFRIVGRATVGLLLLVGPNVLGKQHYQREPRESWQQAYYLLDTPVRESNELANRISHGAAAMTGRDSGGGGSSAGQPNSGETGQPVPEPNRPVWRIQSYGDMSADGYWAAQVHDQFRDGTVWFTQGLLASNEPALEQQLKMDRAARTLPLPTPQLMTGAALKVSHRFEPADFDGGYTLFDGRLWVEIPQLLDTDVVAASANNVPGVQLAISPNGTSVLLVPVSYEQQFELEFWLVPHNPAKPWFRPTKIRDMTFDGVSSKSTQAAAAKMEEAKLESRKAWRAQGVDLQGDAYAVQREADFINQNFAYRILVPGQQEALRHASSFASVMLPGRQGNCLTAADLLALSNPGQLNVVTGYRNHGMIDLNGQHIAYLSTNEAHAWNVDDRSELVDATPTQGVTAQDQQLLQEETFPELEIERNIRTAQATLGMAALTAVGLTFWQRRKIKQLIDKTKTKFAKHQLADLPLEDLETAGRVLNYRGFAPLGTSLTDSQQAAAPPRDQIIDLAQSYAKLPKPKLKQVLGHSAIPGQSASKALRTTRRIVRLAGGRPQLSVLVTNLGRKVVTQVPPDRSHLSSFR